MWHNCFMSKPIKLGKETRKKRDKYWSGAHAEHRIRYLLVFSPKYRKRVLEGKVAGRLEQTLCQACEANRWSLEGLAIQPDHVPLPVQAQPKYSVSAILKKLKSGSSHVLRSRSFPPAFRPLTAFALTAFALSLILLAVVFSPPAFAAKAGDRGGGLNITFPSTLLMQNGGPVINLKRPPEAGMHAAKGDGVTDDTAAFQDVWDLLRREYKAHGPWGSDNSFYVYLPNGTYKVSDMLIYRGATVGASPKWDGTFDINHVHFIGQDRARTVNAYPLPLD